MSGISPYVRTTGLANWNRYAAVNDEFIDIHMDDEAARSVGMPGVFGMGNLRIAYLHNLLADWLGDDGDIAEFRCEFRGLNLRGDTLTCSATATGDGELGGLRSTSLDLSVKNQDDVETCPGSATVVHFDDGKAAMPAEPPPREASGAAAPGALLTQETIDKIGRVLPPVPCPAVGANDIARWAIATHWPDPPPARYVDAAVAAGGPWGGIVAPRDLDPTAWMPNRPWAGDWFPTMGAEPGHRVLNGGQHNRYFAPIHPGDVISVTRRFIDVTERDTKRGPMVFFQSELRWENQDGDLVRVGEQTTIYY